jgi:YVTN family beta-propeller protein
MKTKILFSALLSLAALLCQAQSQTIQDPANSHQVLMPYDRIVQSAGMQIYFGDRSLENHSLDAAVSPDSRWIAVEERFSIVFINTADKKVAFVLNNDAYGDLQGGMNTYSGIIWHKTRKGLEVLWSTIGRGNRSYVASATWDGNKAVFGRLLEYKAEAPSKLALPNEILITNELSKEYIYVILNGNNRVIKQDYITGDTIWSVNPGVAPYGLTMAAGKLYVTNWAGRNPDAGDKDVAGVPWGAARVENKNGGGSTREGSVTVINPATGKILREVQVGLHPNDIISDKSGQFVYVTNSNSDNISVINTTSDNVCETVSVRLQPEINPFFGDSPNGLCLSPEGKTLYVANGMDNAIAVIRLGKNSSVRSSEQTSSVTGFIPTGAYPSAICFMNPGYLYVCNLEAAGARVPLVNKNTKNTVYNSHNMLASVSVIRIPGNRVLQAYTDTVIAVNNLARANATLQKPRESVEPKPVPERVGEPSLFKHVVYIIKENRTYDQVLGDMKQGNGDPGLCIYGADITPNIHKLSEEFMLLDNVRVSGKCSAEGHMWADASIVTDYIEKNVRSWFRSYPHVLADALAYAPSGFIWDNALKQGKSVRIYGEASVPVMDKPMNWADIYKKFKNGEKVEFSNYTTIDPVKNILSQTYPSYGNHEFSDTMRADALIRELKTYESTPGDQLPELMVVALPNDHTAGMRPGYPTPRAMVADNDASLGRIVEAFTKSRFWKNTVIFVIEDDSQSGWDHVSAYRTVSLVLSPYSRFKNVNHSYYTQPSLIKTIELILGMPPMNVQDAIASPMANCFGPSIDLTPYKALPSNIPINEMSAPLSSLSGKALHFAKKSMLPEFDGVDSGNDDLLNRILWFAAKGNAGYPSKYAGSESDDDDD